MNDVGRQVTEAMVQASMSQRQLAAASGLSQSTISRVASGSRHVAADELMAIALALDLPYEDLCSEVKFEDRILVAARTSGSEAIDGSAARRRAARLLQIGQQIDSVLRLAACQ
ncbi:MAG: helix-turn-helix domain-containing protein [Bifidobacteriaceae bacterium]|nr:helix-turn-helix domain-containing protein [Bifidobacteriaceae bacterium]